MYRLPVLFCAATLIASMSLPFSVAAEPSVQCIGLQVVRLPDSIKNTQLAPFNGAQPGTQIALLIGVDQSKIIRFDFAKSRIEAFIDSTRQSLLSEEDVKIAFGTREGFGPFPKISKDGKLGRISIRGSKTPSPSATKVGVKGTLVAMLGSETESIKSKPFALEKGTKISLAGIDFQIDGVGKPSFGNDAQEIKLRTSDSNITNLADVKFYDEKGTLVESRRGSSGRMGFAGAETYTQSYRLKTKLDGKAIIEFETWSDLQETEIPFSVTTTYGG